MKNEAPEITALISGSRRSLSLASLYLRIVVLSLYHSVFYSGYIILEAYSALLTRYVFYLKFLDFFLKLFHNLLIPKFDPRG